MKKYINHKTANLSTMKSLLLTAILLPLVTLAQYPSVKLSFTMEDTVKICKAVVMKSATEPMPETGVNFFVKRELGMIPLGTTKTTDENGVARVGFPLTMPADAQGKVVIEARMEDDEAIKDVAASSWGLKKDILSEEKQNEVWAPRSNVAITMMVISNLIVVVIWGVMAYIAYLVFFQIRKYKNEHV